MANLPTKKWCKGKMVVSLWKGEYDGKSTVSFSVQKNYKKKDGTWANSNFFTEPDLRDLYFLVSHVCDITIKERVVEKKQEVPEDASQNSEEEVNF